MKQVPHSVSTVVSTRITQNLVCRTKKTQFFFFYYSWIGASQYEPVEITNMMQPCVIEFIIPTFTEGSTCFERHTAHHQEL
jgi:hypothetical protein